MALTGKELIYKVHRHEQLPSIPWVPYAGIHAGFLKGYTAIEVLKDADKLLECLLEVNRIYVPDGQPVMFDLQLEAEILGCDLLWLEDNLPAVRSHPLTDTDEIPDKIPQKDEGRLPMVWDVMRRLKAEVGDTTALYGLFCGPFTLASHLRGTNLFLNMIRNQEYVDRLIAYTTRIAIAMADYYAEEGMDVIAAVDPLVSQISPAHFERFFAKPYTELFHHIREKGFFSSYFVCGNATKLIDEMCRTNPDAIAIDENIDMAAAQKITQKYNIVIGGNIPLTTTMLFGNQQDNMKSTIDLIDRLDTDRNVIIAPGCDMPYHVPPANAIACAEAVHEPDMIREVIKNYESTDFDMDIELPDYENLKKPLMEVLTLDPLACAACTYMLASAQEVKDILGEKIDMVEYRYNNREDIARIKKIAATALPSIYINGEMKYPSIIPNRDELIAELEKAM